MITIKLFCAAGFSTGMLVEKMEEAAKKRGLEVEIEACSQHQLNTSVNDIDVALLGPQLGYYMPKAKTICDEKCVPIDVIPMTDYGTMNGEKVLDFALELIEKNK